MKSQKLSLRFSFLIKKTKVPRVTKLSQFSKNFSNFSAEHSTLWETQASGDGR